MLSSCEDQDLNSNPPYSLLYNYYDVSLENLVFDLLIIPPLYSHYIHLFLVISLLDIVLIL